MTNEQYIANETLRFYRRAQDAQKAPLSHRKEALAAYAELLRDPQSLNRNADWLLAGHYGQAEQALAMRAATSRGNKTAQIGVMLALLDHDCPAREAAQAWHSLTPEEQVAASAAIKSAIESAIEAQKEVV